MAVTLTMPSPENVRLIMIFVMWYTVSTGYSMLAKYGMQLDPTASPLLLSVIQFAAGVVCPLFWTQGSLQPFRDAIRAGGPLLALVALGHYVGAYATAASMSLGSVAVTYIVKATEPLFAVGLAALLMGTRYSTPTLLSLVPLSFGLVLACYKPGGAADGLAAGSIVTLGSLSAVLSNLGMGTRNVLTKVRMVMQQQQHEEAQFVDEERGHSAKDNGGFELTNTGSSEGDDSSSTPAENGVRAASLPPKHAAATAARPAQSRAEPHVIFGVMSMYSLLYSLLQTCVDPIARAQLLYMGSLVAQSTAYQALLLSGICHALYTMCSFAVLSRLAPASHAISNSMKHVVVIVAATVLLGNPLSLSQLMGGVLAICGVYCYNRSMTGEKSEAKKGSAVSPWLLPLLQSWGFAGGCVLTVVVCLVGMFGIGNPAAQSMSR